MKLKKSVKDAMYQLQVDKLKRNQIKPINAILNGHDTLVIAPTSYGKSLIYQIPAIIQEKKLTVVIEPLLALIHDQVDKLQNLGIAAAYLDSTQTDLKQEQVMADLRMGAAQILYIAPERLEKDILAQIGETNDIGMVVVDECHCVVSWGHTFRESYLKIGAYIDRLENHPIIVALSATALPEDRLEIMKLLSMQDAQTFEMSLYRSNLQFMRHRFFSRKDQLKALKRCLKKYRNHTAIVFCGTREIAKKVADELKNVYPDDVMVYHSRDRKQEKEMLSGEKHIIVATSALSMGVDVRNVDLVVHYNMPLSLADYYQMAGRAGREGQKARSILLYNPDDYSLNRGLLHDLEDRRVKHLWKGRLDAMKEFCDDTTHCMVKSLLQSLGDAYDRKCRYCTNCQKEK